MKQIKTTLSGLQRQRLPRFYIPRLDRLENRLSRIKEAGRNKMARARILVSGIVQGVCFRDFTCSHAAAMKLTGWVRNRSDGRVEAIVEGPKGDIENLVDLLRRGPRAARVEGVEVTWEEYTGSFRDFRISW